MSARKVVVVVALLLAAAGNLYAADFYKPPVVSLSPMVAVPAVDGKIEAQEWGGAAVLSDFVAVGGQAPPTPPTTVYLGYDDEALYVGAKLFDPQPDQLRAEVGERDGEVWRDDCLELFIDTVGDRKTYAHMVVNALGTKYDSFDRVVSEDFQWHVATSVDEDGWSVEIILPFANQIPPRAGDKWILGVARHAARADELSTWGRHNKSFHEPQNFGTLIFGSNYGVSMDDPGAMWLGENTAFVSVRPLVKRATVEGQPEPGDWVKLNVRVMGRDKAGHFFGAVKQAMSGEPVQVAVPYSIKQDGFSTVAFSLTDHEGVIRWRSAPYPVNVPAVSETLQEAEQKLGQTLVAWVRMPDGEGKQQAQEMLEHLLGGWRYLGERYQSRDRMTRPELESLLLQVQLMTTQADMLLATIIGEEPG